MKKKKALICRLRDHHWSNMMYPGDLWHRCIRCGYESNSLPTERGGQTPAVLNG